MCSLSSNMGSTSTSSSSSASSTQSLITSQVVFTTTLPNGVPTTVTSVTVVPGVQADQSGSSSSASKTSTGGASLQTNGGNQKNLGMHMMLGAAGMVLIGVF